jgi:hypothetical protein
MKGILDTFGHPCSYIWNKRSGDGRGLNNEHGSDKWSQYQTQCGGFSTGVERPMASRWGLESLGSFNGHHPLCYMLRFGYSWVILPQPSRSLFFFLCFKLGSCIPKSQGNISINRKNWLLKTSISYAIFDWTVYWQIAFSHPGKNTWDTVQLEGRCKCPKCLMEICWAW